MQLLWCLLVTVQVINTLSRSYEDVVYDDYDKDDSYGLLHYIHRKILQEKIQDIIRKSIIENTFRDVFSLPTYDKNQECQRSPKFRYTQSDIDGLFLNLKKIIAFFAKNSHEIIVDGLFGMRSAEGTFQYVLKNTAETHPLYPRILKLYVTLHKACEDIYKLHKKSRNKYSKSFLNITNKPFHFYRPWRNFKEAHLWKITQKHSLNEEVSDGCIKGIIGAYKDRGNCYVDKKCWQLETSPGTKGYFLTHQVLYFMAGETNNCHKTFVDLMKDKESLNVAYDKMGSNIYSQMLINYQKMNSKGLDLRDLIAEQGMICQSLGIVECSRVDILRASLDWLDDKGCATDTLSSFDDKLSHYNGYYNYKRVDSLIGKCSQHITSVLLGFYANHLPFIVNPPPCHMMQ